MLVDGPVRVRVRVKVRVWARVRLRAGVGTGDRADRFSEICCIRDCWFLSSFAIARAFLSFSFSTSSSAASRISSPG